MKQLYLRLPEELHERLRKAAAADHRMMTAQVVYLIEKYVSGELVIQDRKPVLNR